MVTIPGSTTFRLSTVFEGGASKMETNPFPQLPQNLFVAGLMCPHCVQISIDSCSLAVCIWSPSKELLLDV